MASTKAYVGAEKIAPAWRTPRRLPVSRIAIAARPSGTACWATPGTAEVIAATPAEIDTATVRTYSVISAPATIRAGSSPRFLAATMYDPPPCG
jgi:hypothetical protein